MKTFDELVEFAIRDDRIIGLVLVGSQGKGLITKYSDYDVNIIIRNSSSKAALEKELADVTNTDIAIYTMPEFKKYADWDTDEAWDRYDFVYSKVLIDKKNGQIEAAVREKTKLPTKVKDEVIERALNKFLNHVFRTFKDLRDKNDFGARLNAMESIPQFFTVVFGIEKRLRPYNKYLLWEIREYPLKNFPWDEKKTRKMIKKLCCLHDPKQTLNAFLDALIESIASTKYKSVLKQWNDELYWMRRQ